MIIEASMAMKPKRRSKEEIEADRAERAARRAAKEAKVKKIAEWAQSVSASFERRAASQQLRPAPVASASMRKAVRKVLRAAAEMDKKGEAEIARITEEGGEARDKGTGLTRLKLTGSPLARLIDGAQIGADEVRAAEEISRAFNALASRLMVKGMTFERIDRSGVSTSFGDAAVDVENYTAWARVWSQRSAAYCDPTLQIVIAAIIDERPLREIAADIGFHHSRVTKALIGGLRDYAARAGFVQKQLAGRWLIEAESVFVPTHPRLLDAVRRARIEK